MCGIAGYLGKNPDKKVLKKMTDRIKHRGPDAEGFYVDDKVALGHRRLSIIDLNTALITTHELKHAYDSYLRLGQEIDEEHESFEEDAIALEKEFVKKYSDIKHNI